MIDARENTARDVLLARALVDAYQKGWDARSTGIFFAADIRPLLQRGRQISFARVADEVCSLRIRSDREFGSLPSFVRVALDVLRRSLRSAAAKTAAVKRITRDHRGLIKDLAK